jgi:hypothetical protein
MKLLLIWAILLFVACLFFAKCYYNSNALARRARREARKQQKRVNTLYNRYYSAKP